MTSWILAAALSSAGALAPAGEVQVGGIGFAGSGYSGTGAYAGASFKSGRRAWVDVDALTAEVRWSSSEQRVTSAGARLRWENTGGSIAAGMRVLKLYDYGCEEPLEGELECDVQNELLVPLPSIEWRAGRLDSVHVTGGLFGGVRSNPSLSIVRAGVGHPVGDVRVEGGLDSTSGAYLLADIPLGAAGTLRTTAGTNLHGVTGGVQILFTFP